MTTTTKILEQKVIEATAAPIKRPGRKFTGATMAVPAADWRKILVLGRAGAGKTFGIVGVLEALNRDGQPNRVFVMDTDIGGGGLASVKQELVARNRHDLLGNIAWFEFPSYRDVEYFLAHPEAMELETADGTTVNLWGWNPDVLIWEGFSNFQEDHITDYVLSMDPLRKEGKDNVAAAREAGLQAEQTDWGNIRRATLFSLNGFLRLHNPNGKKLHKWVTCLLDAGKEDKQTKETKRGPLLMTSARDYMAPAFDLILTADAVMPPGKKEIKYVYRCDITGNTVAKSRGLQVPPEAAADMKTLWTKITAVAEAEVAA